MNIILIKLIDVVVIIIFFITVGIVIVAYKSPNIRIHLNNLVI